MEARLARMDSEESVDQGRIIKVFTFITSFFLPLAFFTSVFSMSTPEINDAPLQVGKVLAIASRYSAALQWLSDTANWCYVVCFLAFLTLLIILFVTNFTSLQRRFDRGSKKNV